MPRRQELFAQMYFDQLMAFKGSWVSFPFNEIPIEDREKVIHEVKLMLDLVGLKYRTHVISPLVLMVEDQ